jgi:uncharacterized phosphosugar-binding protein
MSYEYSEKILENLKKAEEANQESLQKVIDLMAECIKNDKVIHTFGTGHSHMIGIELFARAGGLGNVNAILDPDALTAFGAQRSSKLEKLDGLADIIYENYHIQPGDIMIVISNSGRNPVPVQMAMRAKKEGIPVIALTNLAQSSATTSRDKSGKCLYEVADVILDTCGPSGDALLDIDGIQTGAASSILSMFLLNICSSEAIRKCTKQGIKPYVFQSQNVDGFDNDAIYEHYEGRVKHF